MIGNPELFEYGNALPTLGWYSYWPHQGWITTMSLGSALKWYFFEITLKWPYCPYYFFSKSNIHLALTIELPPSSAATLDRQKILFHNHLSPLNTMHHKKHPPTPYAPGLAAKRFLILVCSLQIVIIKYIFSLVVYVLLFILIVNILKYLKKRII